MERHGWGNRKVRLATVGYPMTAFRMLSWARGLLGACAVLGVLLALPLQAFDATTGGILAAPDRYDRQSVTLNGAITNLSQRESQRGNAYYTFELRDGSGRIRVFSFGQAPCTEGKHVVVDGIFETVKRVGDYTFYNEVSATRVACR